MATAAGPAPAPRASAWGALSHSTFRWVWTATVVSNIGGWSQDIGEGWLMTSLSASALLVAAIQAASAAASVFFSIPGGALADITGNRRVILLMEGWATLIATIMALLAWRGGMEPWSLLVLSFLGSSGSALAGPAWQAITPELVPQADLPGALTLNSLGINIARAIGPALAGVIVSLSGPAAAFTINAASFAGVLLVIVAWRPAKRPSTLRPERLRGAVMAGLRFAIHAAPLRLVIIRTTLFMIFASALWALMPVLVRHELGQGPRTYGLLLASIGTGAMALLPFAPRLRSRFSVNTLVALGSLVLAGGLAVLATVHSVPVLVAAMLATGGAWVLVASSLNLAAQSAVAPWVRARALAIFLTAFFAASMLGSLVWGETAQALGTPAALGAAAAGMVLGVLVSLRFRLRTTPTDFTPTRHWQEPEQLLPAEPDAGPVMVTIEYTIDPARAQEFRDAVQPLGAVRLRDGAVQWGLYFDIEHPGTVTEVFFSPSWTEHLRHHERTSHDDQVLQERAISFQLGGKRPRVTHYTAAPSPPGGPEHAKTGQSHTGPTSHAHEHH
jgi:MFS family permease